MIIESQLVFEDTAGTQKARQIALRNKIARPAKKYAPSIEWGEQMIPILATAREIMSSLVLCSSARFTNLKSAQELKTAK